MTAPFVLTLLVCLLLKHLDGFRKDESAVQTLGYQESDLTVTGIKLIKTLDADTLTVADPVVIKTPNAMVFAPASISGANAEVK